MTVQLKRNICKTPIKIDIKANNNIVHNRTKTTN